MKVELDDGERRVLRGLVGQALIVLEREYADNDTRKREVAVLLRRLQLKL